MPPLGASSATYTTAAQPRPVWLTLQLPGVAAGTAW
jgi:hypothetical protein